METERSKELRRRQWSRAEKEGLIRSWQESGQSRKRFAAENALSYATFASWTKGSNTSKGETRMFAEVEVAVPEIEMTSPGGWRLRIGGEAAKLFARALLERMETAGSIR